MGAEVQTGSTRRISHFWPIVPAPVDCEDGELGGIKIGRGNRSTQRKPPAALFSLDQTQATAVGSQRLTY
jgi:hypothetical protein